MIVITTQSSAMYLFEQLMADARERRAELGRDLHEYDQDTDSQYAADQTKAVRDLTSMAMEVLDMIEVGEYNEKRIIEIRAFFPEVAAKSKYGV
jgi:hypothetical protein